MTVPDPFAAKTRSIHRRGRSSSAAVGVSASMASSSPMRSATPMPSRASTPTIGAPSRNVPATCSSTSSSASSRRSSSTRPTFVSATSPCRTSSISRIRRCSSDCGFQPSVAATTNTAASTAPTPASMLRMKRSCPGTSTNDTERPDGSSAAANPRSMVSPRSFSSVSRSGSVPVRAFTSVDLPWSTCPAVETTWLVTAAPGRRRQRSRRRPGRSCACPARFDRRPPGR